MDPKNRPIIVHFVPLGQIHRSHGLITINIAKWELMLTAKQNYYPSYFRSRSEHAKETFLGNYWHDMILPIL